MGIGGSSARVRTVFGGVRRVHDATIAYELVLPAVRLLSAEPLLERELDEHVGAGFPVAGARVVVSRPLSFAPIDDERGFGLATLPLGTRLGFDGPLAIRHGMVRVTVVAPLPETVWRLDERFEVAAA